VLLNRVYQPSERTYASSRGLARADVRRRRRTVAVRGEGRALAFDLSVEAVRQRDFDGRFGFRDYRP